MSLQITPAYLDLEYNAPESSYKKIVRLATTADLAASTFSAGVITGYAQAPAAISTTSTAASTTITVGSTATVKTGAVISVANAFVPAGLTVTVASATTMTLSASTRVMTTTAASGSGTVATLTFAAQTYTPYAVGASIVVAGVTPAGYNGTFTVTACTTTTVSYSSATTGAQTVAGTVTQTVAAGTANLTFINTIAALTIDSVATVLNDRVLIKDQRTVGGITDITAAKQNGIYRVTAIGSTTVAWSLARTQDADASTDLDSAIVNVSVGTANYGKTYKTRFSGTSTLNTTEMYWSRVADVNSSSLAALPVTATAVHLGTDTETIMFKVGAVTDLAMNALGITTVQATGASTYTRASTLYIAGAPVASTNATITAPLALYVVSGNSYFGGGLSVGGTADTATAATHYYVETGTDGYVRPKLLADVRTELVTTAAVNSAAATTVGTVTSGIWNAGAVTSSSTIAAGGAGTIGRLRVKQSGNNFDGGLTLQRSDTLDTVSIVHGGDNILYFGYATAASLADASADFTQTMSLSSAGWLNVAGNVGVGSAAPNTIVGAYIWPIALTGTAQYGTISYVTSTSASTLKTVAITARANTAAAAYTTADMMHLEVQNGTKGAGSTITNQHGLYIPDLTSGTNNYGVYSAVSVTANRWNIYAVGTAANFFKGAVLIGDGTTSPELRIDGDGAAAAGAYMTLYKDGTRTQIIGHESSVYGAGSTSSNLVNYAQSAATSYKWNFASTTHTLVLSSTSLDMTGAITATGNITAYFSDDRLKDRIGNIPNALDKVLSLNGFYYTPNETAQALGYECTQEVGVSAQEVQRILPEIVVPAPIDDKYLTVRYEKIIPLLIEAIKDQQKIIDSQEARIARLEALINTSID